MPDPKIQVHLMMPMDPRFVSERLAEAGFDVEALWVVRGGAVSAADIARFIVERIDRKVIGLLAGVVSDLIVQGTIRCPNDDKGVGFSIKDREKSFLIGVTGDGSWVQLRPTFRKPADEEQ